MSMSKDERSKLYKERAVLKREKAEMFSLWCDALYRLSLANHVCILLCILLIIKNESFTLSL